MTIIESILAYMAGEAQSLPATTNTEEERLMKKIAQRLDSGLLPVPTAPVSPAASVDAGKVPTVKNDGTYKLAAIPTELPAIGDSDSGKVLTVSNELAAEWAALPSDDTEPTT